MSIQHVSATTITYLDKYSEFDGNGEPEYPNTGYMYGHAYLLDDSYSGTWIKYFHNYESYDPKGHICYVKAVGSASVENGCSWFDTGNAMIGQHWDTNFIYVAAQHNTGYDRGTHELYTTGSSQYRPAFDLHADHACAPDVRIINAYILVYFSPYNDTYYINGTYSCIDNVSLYGYINSTYKKIDYTNNTPYSFVIFNNIQYKLVFSDGHEYEFTCNGSDIEYDYSACTYIYGYTCNINWVKLWRDDAGSWTCIKTESQPYHGVNIYLMQIESGYNYKLNFSDGHEYEFTCDGSDIEYDWDRCVWVYPPSPWQPPEIIPWYLGYDNNIVFMRDSHGNFIENAQIAVYNKNTGNYTQKWTNTPDPYILLAANNDSNDDVIVLCRTFDGVFTLETVDPAFGTDENVTWTNWTIPIMYNLKIHPIDQSNMPLHRVFVSMYEYTPFDPLAFFGYDIYWGCIPVTNCSGFSRCDIVAEKEGYRDYNVTGLNWTTKSALVKDYKQDIILVRES